MTDKPIIFSGPMVRALLDGRKTQTRRLVKINDHLAGRKFTGDLVDYYGNGRLGMVVEGSTLVQPIPYAPGDRLWVKETFARACEVDGCGCPISAESTYYRADGEPFDSYVRPDGSIRDGVLWKPSIHMPRWASRLTLHVTDVRVQRLQEIRGQDCIAEGVECETCAASWSVGRSACNQCGCFEIRQNFRDLWNSLYGPDAWDANPWVCAISFEVERQNIDQAGFSPKRCNQERAE